MYKFLCGIGALILGLVTISGYDFVFSSHWYSTVSERTVLLVLDGLSLVFKWDSGISSWTLTMAQAVLLSLIFALLFSMVLDVFNGITKAAQYAIFGICVGILYIALPVIILFVEQRYINNQLVDSLKVVDQLLNVLVAYLPLLLLVLYVALRRKSQSKW